MTKLQRSLNPSATTSRLSRSLLRLLGVGKRHASRGENPLPAATAFAIHACELENRVLYSGSPLPVEMLDPAADTVPEIDDASWETQQDSIDLDSLVWSIEDTTSDMFWSIEDPAPATALQPATELIFIDTGVDEYQSMIDDVQSRFNDGSVQVILLDGDDAISQITDALADHDNLQAVHIVSHGNQGQVNLGDVALSRDNLASYAGQIAMWSTALSADADMLFYGCDLAGNAAGVELLESLSELTDADVAASDDATGHASLGGDWDLEFSVGMVEASVVFTEFAKAEWFGLLATVAVTEYLDSDGDPVGSTQTAAPTDPFPIPDYDGDGQPGLTIEKDTGNYGETASGKHQIWHTDGGGYLVDGNVSVTIWAAMQNFDPKDGEFHVYLTETDLSGGNALLSPLASFTIFTDELDWSGGFDMKVADFGSITHFVEPGRALAIKITVDDGLSQDKMIFAYDRIETPSRLEFTMETSGAPTISNLNGDTLNYTEDDGPLVIDQGTGASIVDGDSGNFDGGLFYAGITSGGSSGEDILSIRNQGSGGGQIGFDGVNVTYSGTQIGTATGGSGGVPLRISLNTSADDAAISALAQNITYENSDIGDPSTASRTVEFYLHDGEGGVSPIVNATVNVSALNDAPVLDNLGNMTLTTIEQDNFSSPGDTVAAIVASAGGNRITDPDGTGLPEGIAVIGVNDTNGTWEYSTTGGSSWRSLAVDGAGPNSAVLLNTAALIRFVPNPGYFGSGGDITFHAWDQTSGANGDRGVPIAAQTGGTNAFSVDTETATIKVNDPPETSGIPNQNMDEDDPDLDIDLFPHFSDSEDSDSQLTYSVTGNTNSGLFDGTPIISGQFLRLDLNADQHGSADITVRATDQDGWFVDTTFTVTVDPVNDDPAIIVSGTANVVEGNTIVTTVSSTDIDGGAPNYTITGGADQGLFLINSTTGELTFDTAPDFESPTDADSNNIYEVEVTVDDGNLGSDAKTINVNVVDAYILDEFNAFTYSGNDGTVNWSGDWIESDSGGPNGGDIIVLGSLELYIRTNQLNDDIFRVADLSGATSATLTFDTNNTLFGAAQVVAEVRTGTGTWTVLDTFDATNPGIAANSHDLTPFMAADTQIRFRVAAQQNSAVITIDNVRIEFEGATSNSPPTDIAPDSFNIDENIDTTGEVSVGLLSATDPDSGETFTFSIEPGLDGTLFSIGGAGDELFFDDGVLNYETKDTYGVNVLVKDSVGNTYLETLALNVNNLNEAPVLTTAALDPVFNENGGQVALFTGTNIDLIDTGDLVDTLVITVDSLANGSDEKLVVDGQDIELTHLNAETTTTNSYNVSVSVSGNTATVTITKATGFTAGQAETLVDGLAYNNANENPLGASRNITLTSIKDDGGAGGGNVDTQALAITSQVDIQPDNDPPVAAIGPAAFGVNEDDSPRLLFGLTVSDVDAGSNDVEVRVSVLDGILTIGNLTGLTITSGSNGSGSVTVQGNLTDLNNALTTLTYRPDPDFFGTDTITLHVDDLGNTGGSPLTSSDTASIFVTAVNDASSLTGIEGTNASYTENGVPTQITNAILISDVDDTDIDSATIQITGNYTAGDELLFTDTATITHFWDGGTGTLTLTGGDSLANYIAALRSVTFENTGDDPTALTRTISITVNDGDDDSNTLTRDIDVTPVNDAPVITVDPTNLAYASGSIPVDPLLNVTDVDNTELIGATVRFGAGFISGEDTLVFVDQNGITGSFNAVTGVLTLTGTADVADYEAALQSVEYENTNPTPTVGTLRVRFRVDDGTDLSGWDRRTIEIINDEPPRASDDSGNVNEGGAVIIDLAGNDSDNNNLLDLTSIVIKTGPSFGTLFDNLDGTFTYTHNGSETLSDSFTYTIKDDLGLESNEATVFVTVNPINDDPVISGPVSSAATEDDAGYSVDLLTGASDAEGDTLNVSGLTLTGGNDVGVTIAGNNLTVDPSAYNDLAVGESEIITYSYVIIDGNGG
ncbi:MAG: DUF4347 domain-containing protein, partial [Pirellulaceae bacterium]